MGFFSFLKKKEQIKEREVISQSQLLDWISNNRNEYLEKEQKFLYSIKEIISKFTSELEDEIIILEDDNLMDSNKVEPRVKLIVEKNLNNYVLYLEKLIKKLREIENIAGVIEKINLIFEDFNKKSGLSYQKATFIVGKELQATKDSIRKFFTDLRLILNTNKEFFEKTNIIKLIEMSLEELNKIKEKKSEILKSLEDDMEEVKSLERSIETKKDDIREIELSSKYFEEKKKEELLKEKKLELKRNVIELGKIINFKDLSSFYHKFEGEMSLVKQYKYNFSYAVKGQGLQKLESLLKEANLTNERILELIEKINRGKEKIKEIKIEDTGISFLENSMEKVKSKIDIINSEKPTEENRLKDIEEKLIKTMDSIEDNLNKVNVDLK